ncbi:MAG TPA: ABC transporter substrate-binding protein [Stellaceae bacterium]|nr:ABC transporter substrate-binding protein [Stellaceae bacterium]
MRPIGRCLLAAMAFLCAAAAPVWAAQQQVSVGKAVGEAWTFLPLDIGQRYGIFARYGLDLNIIVFQGDAKLQQGLASNSISFGLGSGPGMAFAVKGSPAIAVAAYFGAPKNISVIVSEDSPIKTVTGLKDKTIAISTAGSLTEWLVERISLAQGWAENGIKTAALGGLTPGVAAMRSGAVDAVMGSTEGGYMLEEKHAARILVATDKYAPVFITHVVFARKALVADEPDLVTRFLQGFFATIDFMKTHKAETDKVAEEVLKFSPAVAERAYDHEIGGFVPEGRFDPKAVGVLKRSFVEMGILPTEPADSGLFTTRFVPVKADGGSAAATTR